MLRRTVNALATPYLGQHITVMNSDDSSTLVCGALSDFEPLSFSRIRLFVAGHIVTVKRNRVYASRTP